jgi:Zn-dependent M28 family amino/carboxypeptidase
MPGRSYAGALPPLTQEQSQARERLRRDVNVLADDIGERNVWRKPAQLEAAANFIGRNLAASGYVVRSQTYWVRGTQVRNLEVEVPGATRPEEIVIVGAHYDSELDCPAADDNASGVAATLELARRFASPGAPRPDRTLRFVLWVNEEEPFFHTSLMGSRVYANRSHQRGEKIVAAISLEMLGYYTDRAFSQWLIPPFNFFYPHRGNFIGFIGNWPSRQLVADAVASFRAHAQFPSEGFAGSDLIPGVGFSDHWSFWQEGYPAFMVTDTAFFRYKNYHQKTDTPEKLDYARMARVVDGLQQVLIDLAQARPVER